MSELHEYLASEEIDYATFSIESLNGAIFALRRLALAQEKIESAKAIADAEKAKIDDWVEMSTRVARESSLFFEQALKDFMARVREESVAKIGERDATKSISLPNGELTSRAIPAKAQVTDEELFVKWCLANHRESWIRTKESANLAALKDEVNFVGDLVVDSSGVVIEGLTAIEADVSVTVKVSH